MMEMGNDRIGIQIQMQIQINANIFSTHIQKQPYMYVYKAMLTFSSP